MTPVPIPASGKSLRRYLTVESCCSRTAAVSICMSVEGLKAGLGVCGIGNFGVGGGDIQPLKEIAETGDVNN